MKRHIYAAIFAALVLGLVGCGKVDDAIKASNESIAAGNYDEAISSLQAGIADAELKDEQKTQIEAIFTSAATSKGDDIDAKMSVWEQGISLIGTGTSLDSACIDAVKAEIDYDNLGRDYKKAKQYADKLIAILPEDETAKTVAADAQKNIDEEQKYIDILIKAQGLIEAEKWQELADFEETDEVAELRQKIGDVGNYTYVAGGGNSGEGIGYYSMEGCECNEWYFGDYENGLRSGDGGWYWAKNENSELYTEIYVGEFADDKPNGKGVNTTNMNGAIYTHTGNVVDGLYDGEIDIEFETEELGLRIGKAEIHNGIPEEVNPDDYKGFNMKGVAGEYVFAVVMPSEDKSAATMFSTDGKREEGVAHFRNAKK